MSKSSKKNWPGEPIGPGAGVGKSTVVHRGNTIQELKEHISKLDKILTASEAERGRLTSLANERYNTIETLKEELRECQRTIHNWKVTDTESAQAARIRELVSENARLRAALQKTDEDKPLPYKVYLFIEKHTPVEPGSEVMDMEVAGDPVLLLECGTLSGAKKVVDDCLRQMEQATAGGYSPD